MHTSDILRSEQFRVVNRSGEERDITAGLTTEHRLGVVSPCYEDAILGASAAMLRFVTAFYDLQRARQGETGEPFFVYADYFVFLFAGGPGVRGQAAPAPLEGAVSLAYGWLDMWPEEKWVIVRDAPDLWARVAAHGVTHLLLPERPAIDLGSPPQEVTSRLAALYYYSAPDAPVGVEALRIELAAEPLEVIAEAVRRLPEESPAHAVRLAPHQHLWPAM